MAEDFFVRLHKLLGIPLKEGKDAAGCKLNALGHNVVCTQQGVSLAHTKEREDSLLEAVRKATRHGFETVKASQGLSGRLGFAAEAAYGRIGRAFVRTILSANIESVAPMSQQPEVVHALGWWETLLKVGVFRVERFRRPTRRCVVFPDGYWDQEKNVGGAGALLLTPDGNFAFGGMIPAHLRSQLQDPGTGRANKQRNTQAELLAILLVLLTMPEAVRDCE